jgi:hypothetical protein
MDRPGPLESPLLRSAAYAGLAVAAVGAWLPALLVSREHPAKASYLAVMLLAPYALMAWAWWRRFEGEADLVGVLGAWVATLTGYALPQVQPWMLWAPFLLPWALLLVELPARHRVLLLVVQWLSSIAFLEGATHSTASTTAVAALSVAHLVLVWASLRGSPLAGVPLLAGLLIGLASLLVSVAFLAQGASAGRWEAVAASLALLAAVGLLHKGWLLPRARMPSLVRMRPA